MTTRKKAVKELIILGSIVLGGVVRILYLLLYPVQSRDAYGYKEILDYWFEHKNYPYDITSAPPLGILFLGIPKMITYTDTFLGGIIMNMLLGLCIIMMILIVCSKILPSNSYLLIIGPVIATHPTLVNYSCQMLRENVFLFWGIMSINSIVNHFKSPQKKHIILAATFAAVACLCRYEAVELLLATLIYFVFLLKKNTEAKRIVGFSLLYIFQFTAVLLLILHIVGIPLNHYYGITKQKILIKQTLLMKQR